MVATVQNEALLLIELNDRQIDKNDLDDGREQHPSLSGVTDLLAVSSTQMNPRLFTAW